MTIDNRDLDFEHSEFTPRKRTLTDADIEALREAFSVAHKCSFSAEEVQFVRSWLETMQTVKSEVIKKVVTGVFWFIGVLSGIIVAAKMGYFK